MNITGLSISVLTQCKGYILYHIQECIKTKANKNELVEAIKIGVIGGGSITYPSVRYAIKIINNLEVQ